MTKATKQQFVIEMTDTYGGEANYSWVKHFLVTASSFRGAISKVTKETGYHARIDCDYGDGVAYKVPGAAIMYILNYACDSGDVKKYYPNIKEL